MELDCEPRWSRLQPQSGLYGLTTQLPNDSKEQLLSVLLGPLFICPALSLDPWFCLKVHLVDEKGFL